MQPVTPVSSASPPSPDRRADVAADAAPYRRRIDEQLRLAAAVRERLPGAAVPYFAHLRVHSGGRERDLLLGAVAGQLRIGAGTDGGATLIDWWSAPLAEAFFAADEGEDYELGAGERTLCGTVVERNLPSFQNGELVELRCGDVLLSRRGDGTWRRMPAAPRALLVRPEPERAQARRRSPIEVELDAVQEAAVARPAGTQLLVLGEAGCGKTTVALHRLARLRASTYASARCVVLVPSEGLRRLCELLLSRLGVHGVEVCSYPRWAAQQARRTFADLPERESEDATAAVPHIKRHPALRRALQVLAERPRSRPTEATSKRRPRGTVRRQDLLHLFGDRALLERAAAAAEPPIPSGMIAELLEHTHVQFSQTTEQAHAHVDADRLVATDGRLLDEGTPTADAGTVDVEDYAVLFELDRLRAAAQHKEPARPPGYGCIVVDECQELAPLELMLIGRSLAPGGSLIVAGDAEQQVDPSAYFPGWPGVLRELGAEPFEITELVESYRCPGEVLTLAQRIRSPGAGRAAPSAPTAPSRVGWFRAGSECHLVDWLIRELAALQDQDPDATIAVILRSAESARRTARGLGRGLPVRLALDGNFDFKRGISVTCVAEVKGLEFEYVLVPDASSAAYPESPQARRALYVAATRATQQLVLGTSAEWSPILVETGLLERADQAAGQAAS